MSELEEMTLTELREIAKEQNIKNVSKLKKEELIGVLIDVQRSRNKAEEQEKKKVQQLEKKPIEIKYDEEDEEIQAEGTVVGDSTVDYKLTNEEDEIVEGILEVLPDGYGFLRGDNYLSSTRDVYISPVQKEDLD